MNSDKWAAARLLRFARNDYIRLDYRIYPILICAIAALGFYLRIKGISWGIPFESNWLMSYHYDEGTYLMGIAKMQPSRLDFNVHDFHWGTVQFYFVWIALKTAQLFGYVDATWMRLFHNFDMQEATMVFVSGRMVSVIFGTLTIPLVFFIGKELQGIGTGLLASLFIALMPIHVVNSHYLTSDITMCFFVLLTFFACLLTFRSSNRSLYIMQGLFCGFAIATKRNACFVILAIVTLHLLQRETRWQVKWIAYPFISAGFLIGEPYALLSFKEFLLQERDFLFVRSQPGIKFTNLLYHLKYMFYNTMGTVPLVVSLAGIFFLLKRRLKQDIFLLSAIAAFAISVALTNFVMVRYTIPVVAFLTLCSALFIYQLKGKILRFSLIIIVALFEICISVANVNIMDSEHTGNMAAMWINKNIEKGKSIGRNSRTVPPVRHTKYKTSFVGWSEDSSGAHMSALIGKHDFIIMTNPIEFYRWNKFIGPDIKKYYKLLERFENRPSIFGIPVEGKDVPHDWKYSHPTIEIYKRKW